MHLFAQKGQQKTCRGSAEPELPRRLAPGSAPVLLVPAALTVPVAQLNGFQAEVFDHLLTGAGGAVEGMIQARNLHFSNSLSSPPASYPGFLGVLGGREGREKDGEWWREGRRPETLRGRGCVCGLESQGRDDGCSRSAGECAALRNRESPGARAGGARSRRGGDAARGEREGKGAARARARARTRPPAGAPHSPSSALPRARASGCPRATARATPRVRRWTAERAGTEGGGGCCALAWLSVLVRAIWRSFPPHSVSRSSGWHCGVCTGR